MHKNTVYFLVKKLDNGRFQSLIDEEPGKPYQFPGRMLPDRIARALRADGIPCLVVGCDLTVEEPKILPRGVL